MKASDKRKLGLALKSFRLTDLRSVARVAGLSASTISRLEHGQKEPSVNDLQRLIRTYASGPEFLSTQPVDSGKPMKLRRS